MTSKLPDVTLFFQRVISLKLDINQYYARTSFNVRLTFWHRSFTFNSNKSPS